jgi:hypothetical protein
MAYEAIDTQTVNHFTRDFGHFDQPNNFIGGRVVFDPETQFPVLEHESEGELTHTYLGFVSIAADKIRRAEDLPRTIQVEEGAEDSFNPIAAHLRPAVLLVANSRRAIYAQPHPTRLHTALYEIDSVDPRFRGNTLRERLRHERRIKLAPSGTQVKNTKDQARKEGRRIDSEELIQLHRVAKFDNPARATFPVRYLKPAHAILTRVAVCREAPSDSGISKGGFIHVRF